VEAVQKQCKNENILNSLSAINHKNKHNAADNSEKVVRPYSKQYQIAIGQTDKAANHVRHDFLV